jgi:hypothetical protein
MKNSKRLGTMIFLLMLAVACYAGDLLAKGKPVHGGNSNQEPRARFVFSPSASLTGDVNGFVYEDDPGGVEAYFMGSGNPKLELGDPLRSVVITFDGPDSQCLVAGETYEANGDALWFSGLADESGELIDPSRFLSMGEEDNPFLGYSKMILRFILQDEFDGKDYLWKVVFGDADGSSRVKVTREGDTWHVEGLDYGSSTAIVNRFTIKGKSGGEPLGLCTALIDFDIELIAP